MARALAIAGRDEAPAVTDVPAAEPGPGQVRVAVDAASVNGIDAATAAGYLWEMIPHTFPVVIGRDFAGTVDAVGDGVTAVRPGDKVAGTITGMSLDTGALTESVTVTPEQLAALPAGVSAVDAAAVGLAGLTAIALLEPLNLTAADTVLVSGASGGVGVIAVQLATKTGATVLGTARPGEAADTVRKLGAHPVDHTGDLAGEVKAAAPGGVTAVIHLAGDAGDYAAFLAPGGRLSSAVGATPEQAGRDDVTVTGVMAQVTPAKLETLLDAIAAGDLQVPVMRTYPLADAPQALADFGGRKVGKLVVTFDRHN